MKKQWKRWTAIWLIVSLVVGTMLPTTAFAAENIESDVESVVSEEADDSSVEEAADAAYSDAEDDEELVDDADVDAEDGSGEEAAVEEGESADDASNTENEEADFEYLEEIEYDETDAIESEEAVSDEDTDRVNEGGFSDMESEDGEDSSDDEDSTSDAEPADGAIGLFEEAENVEVVPADEANTEVVTEVNPLYEDEIDESDLKEPASEEMIAEVEAETAEEFTIDKNEDVQVLYDEASDSSILLYDDGTAVDVLSDTVSEAGEDTSSERAASLGTDMTAGGNTYTDDLSKAASTLRKSLVNREETIVVYYYTEGAAKDASMYKTVFNEACKHTGVPKEGDYIRWHYAGLTANTSYLVNEKMVRWYYKIVFTMTYYTTAAQESTVDSAINSLISDLKLSSLSTDYAKVRKIYDYICENVSYDYANLNNSSYTLKHTAYAAVKNHTCVCQGYALLFYRLALSQGIDNRLIAGYGTASSSSSTHAWTIVKLDGKYYNIDPTWDAKKSAYSYFLLNEDNFTKSGVYHKRWGASDGKGYDYNTSEFYAAYPMSSVDYTASTTTNISGATVSLEKSTFEYTGKEIKPSITVKYGGSTLKQGGDYTIAYANNTDIGTGTITISGIRGYSGSKNVTFQITGVIKDISKGTLTLSGISFTYTGEEIRPEATVKFDGETLSAGTDYTVTYSNNVNKGTAVVVATGLGMYTGSLEAKFTIGVADLREATMAFSGPYTYTGSAQTPVPTVRLVGNTLSSGTDYTLRYSNNTNVGTATVVATGKGNYSGTITGYFDIAPLSLAGATITIPSDKYIYTGESIEPTPSVKLNVNGKDTMLKRGTDYTVSYQNNTRASDDDEAVLITITGYGNYTGSSNQSFFIVGEEGSTDLAAANVTLSFENRTNTYNGSEIRPEAIVTMKDGEITLKEGEHYTVTYENNIKIGNNTAKAIITAIDGSGYTGSKTKSCSIQKGVQAPSMWISDMALPVGSRATVSVYSAHGTTRFSSSNTEVATVSSTSGLIYANSVGTTTIIVEAVGDDNYNMGSATMTITVIPVKPTISGFENESSGVKVSWKKVATAGGYYVYRNNKKVGTVSNGSTVSYTDKGAKSNGTKYTYTVYSFKKLGNQSYTSKVSTEKSTYYVSSPSVSLKNSTKGKMTVSWKKNTAASGYQVQYSTSSKFSGAKTVKVSKNSTTSKVLSGLKKGKKYYVRVKALRSSGDSDWSSTKSLKVKK